MNQDQRRMRDWLYRRLIYIETVSLSKPVRGESYAKQEARSLRWMLKLVEEADAAGLLPQLEAANNFNTADWLKRQQEIEEADRAARIRKANKLAMINALNEPDEPPKKDAMRWRVPGSFESSSGRRPR